MSPLTVEQVQVIHDIIERYSTDVVDYELATDDINAALAESQPAPAGFPEAKDFTNSEEGPAPATHALTDVCGNCGHPIFAHGRNGCTHYVEKYKAECGCLGGEVRPAPAKEKP